MTLRTDVSVLYVDPRGPYPKLVADWWDEKRDARLYAGPNPVVAHPPCGPWGALKHLYKGAEHDCAPRAVEQVRTFGGVLEHPEGSALWRHCYLPHVGARDSYGFTVQIDQCDWGHVARKPTWLYVVGGNLRTTLDAIEDREGSGRPTHWCSGSRTNKGGGSVPPGIKVCSAQQRRIADGRCKPLECDRGRAKGLWQLHRNTLNRDSWAKQDGDIELQAHLASEQLKRAFWTCRRSGVNWLTGTINAYAGRRCSDASWPGLQARVATYGRLR